jgi:hypothetical protein
MKHAYVDSAETETQAPRIERVWVVWLDEDSPDSSYLEQEGFEERLAEYEAGNFHFMGCQARAEVSYPIGQGCRRLEQFSSGGLWGIESDSERSFLQETEKEELADLKAHLERFGVDTSDFDEKTEVA